MEYTGLEFSERLREFFGRYEERFTSIARFDNYRSVSEQMMNHGAEGVLSIYETAVPERRAGGSWETHDGPLLWGEVDILTDEGKGVRTLKCTQREDDEDTAFILGDNGEYIASYRGDVILLFGTLDNLTTEGLEMLFTYFDEHPLTELEILKKRLEKIYMGSVERGKKEVEQLITSQKERMDESFANFMGARTGWLEGQIKLKGLDNMGPEVEENIARQLERLYRSPDCESIELSKKGITIITKPIQVGLWILGQYAITFDPKRSEPDMRRIAPPTGSERFVPLYNEESTIEFDHPHIHNGDPCAGNAGSLLRSFWEGDFLTGFNFAVQFLRSYKKDGGPSIRFENYLKTIGYFHDAQVLYEAGCVRKIENGDVRGPGRRRWTDERLREMGCTGELGGNYTDYLDDIREHRASSAQLVQLESTAEDGFHTCVECGGTEGSAEEAGEGEE